MTAHGIARFLLVVALTLSPAHPRLDGDDVLDPRTAAAPATAPARG
ncbi:MAG: hypothetical protein ACJ780_30155 [Solirubrobacteraceae bacterium]